MDYGLQMSEYTTGQRQYLRVAPTNSFDKAIVSKSFKERLALALAYITSERHVTAQQILDDLEREAHNANDIPAIMEVSHGLVVLVSSVMKHECRSIEHFARCTRSPRRMICSSSTVNATYASAWKWTKKLASLKGTRA